MKTLTRLIRAVPILLAALAVAPASQAQEYPTKTIRLLVPFPVGGAADIVARMLAADMSATLGRSIVVENRGGASGNIAMDAAARSTPDGYTLLLASASLAINTSLIKATPFDPEKDFTPISLIATAPRRESAKR